MKIRRVLAIPDPQAPFHDAVSMSILEEYMADHRWDEAIYLGDFLDYFCISKYNEGKPGTIEGRTILKELQQGERLLQRHVDILRRGNKACKIIYLQGNHEQRAYDWVSRYPHLKGLIEPENVLKFDEKDIQYVKCWADGDIYNIGKAYFTHGNYTNTHHAKKMVEAYEENIFYGHTHDCNSFNKTAKGTGKTKVGQSLGTLCAYPKDVDYMKGRPSNWQQAFGVFYFLPNGQFHYYVVRIFNDSFVSPEGKFYTFHGKK